MLFELDIIRCDVAIFRQSQRLESFIHLTFPFQSQAFRRRGLLKEMFVLCLLVVDVGFMTGKIAEQFRCFSIYNLDFSF